ncbi:hypothetical protein Nepgr_006262 [Nepenthes gracilis]|uniref:Late embryogenesis abundant protein LEA-2 subgroup domain-containing protein n=1 Tax=Nepenthes gracilis TaxID=150966 RepID=A0AAD3XH79_NEPGR|nr:hypothetical protein Nepgr_006262 [Nepenthes gracilis]
MDAEEEEEALSSYSYSLPHYYVQSPSTLSHADTTPERRNHHLSPSAFQSPPSENFIKTSLQFHRCESSRSFIHHKKISYDDLLSQGTGVETLNAAGEDRRVLTTADSDRKSLGDCHDRDLEAEEDDDDDAVFYNKGEYNTGGWWWWRRWLSFGTYPSSYVWISLQLCWRLLVSFSAALLVFYIVTKPPPPHISIKIIAIGQFELGEGVDAHGVGTNILTFNSSMEIIIDNKSKVYGLHIFHPSAEISFGHFPLARSLGPNLFAPSHHATPFKLYVEAANKPMYGAGRNMADMLESGKGLPLVLRVALTSNFYVIGSLVKPIFHHHAVCSLVLQNVYDEKLRTQAFNSSCNVISN